MVSHYPVDFSVAVAIRKPLGAQEDSEISSDYNRLQIDNRFVQIKAVTYFVFNGSSDHVFSGGSFFAVGSRSVDLSSTAWKKSICRSSKEGAWP